MPKNVHNQQLLPSNPDNSMKLQISTFFSDFVNKQLIFFLPCCVWTEFLKSAKPGKILASSLSHEFWRVWSTHKESRLSSKFHSMFSNNSFWKKKNLRKISKFSKLYFKSTTVWKLNEFFNYSDFTWNQFSQIQSLKKQLFRHFQWLWILIFVHFSY